MAVKMTPEQNNALHLWFRRAAQEFNDRGIDLKMLLEEKSVSVPVNEHIMKEVIWRPVQEAMTGKHSTQELGKVEPGDVFEVVSRHLGEHFGIYVPWPESDDE